MKKKDRSSPLFNAEIRNSPYPPLFDAEINEPFTAPDHCPAHVNMETMPMVCIRVKSPSKMSDLIGSVPYALLGWGYNAITFDGIFGYLIYEKNGVLFANTLVPFRLGERNENE